MRRFIYGLSFLFFSLFPFSCREQSASFITDPVLWEQVQSDFRQKHELLGDSVMGDVFSQWMTHDERQAMTFLYAYMPVCDIVDYSSCFHLKNVRYAFLAREMMPWGESVPEKEFRHFVLPLRVNNENLDSCRDVFFKELKDRVKDLSMYDAVLEVNHWCHEKAVYQPTDARTSSPLATVKTAYGRCGEESTLLVSALRSVCIPARQVYTPRWAHTDDNHAWVEAYVDGSWHFLGACEPEPVLDMAWFNDPVARGMLMHTKVFGPYPGPEDIMRETPLFTEINVVGNYADTASVRVKVLDADRKPVGGIPVEFKLYNYAEFFTVASKKTDDSGQVHLTAGKGDMLVWAGQGARFGFSKVSFGKDKEIEILLDKPSGYSFELALDMVPPVEKKSSLQVTDSQREYNRYRLLQEDSIRNAYVAMFYRPDQAARRAMELGMDTGRLSKILVGSRGNGETIDLFLDSLPQGRRGEALVYLENLSEKDWRDVSFRVLEDHFFHTPLRPRGSYSASFHARYVMNPRVAAEQLSVYKVFFEKELPDSLRMSVRENPKDFASWVARNIRVENSLNQENCPITPSGVFRARVADSRSRDIFFVSVLRAMGIASRIDGVTGKVQYALKDDAWKDVDFEETSAQNRPQGKLQLTYDPVRALPDPVYYSHFTISRYQNGTFRLLTYPEDKASTWKRLFSRPSPMDTGYYLLATGTRMSGGEVLANLSFLQIKEGQTTAVPLVMRDDPRKLKVIGNFDSEALYFDPQTSSVRSVLQTAGRGYFLVAILGAGQEPTDHALRELASIKDELEKWGRTILLLFSNEAEFERYGKSPVCELPSNVVLGVDLQQGIEKEMVENLRMEPHKRPMLVLGDTFNRVVFSSQGYDTSLGQRLLRAIHAI